MLDDVDNEELKGIPKDLTYTDLLPRGYLSVSQVAQYHKCGMAYYYRYIEEIKTPPNSFMAQGTAVHRATEKVHLVLIDTPDAPPPLGYLEAAYEGEIDNLMADPDLIIAEQDKGPGTVKDVGIELVRVYYKGAIEGTVLDPDTKKPYSRIQPIHAERTVRTMLELPDADPVPFLGVIDMEEANEISDTKTKAKLGSQAEVDNSLQLSLYAEITKTGTGKDAVIKRVRQDQVIKPTKTLPARYIRRWSTRPVMELEHAKKIVSETATDIIKGRFRRTMPENWWCTTTWCPYWSRCRGKKV